MKKYLRAVLSALMVSALMGAAPSWSKDTIRIGFVADETGMGMLWTKGQRAAIDLFIDEANESGGILGKKLELIVHDSAMNPALGKELAETNN